MAKPRVIYAAVCRCGVNALTATVTRAGVARAWSCFVCHEDLVARKFVEVIPKKRGKRGA